MVNKVQDEISAAEIAEMDAVLLVAARGQWDTPDRLARWAAPAVGERLGVSEAEAEAIVLKYVTALAAGAELDESPPRKYPRYSHAAILADAYATAAAGAPERRCYFSSGEYGFDAS